MRFRFVDEVELEAFAVAFEDGAGGALEVEQDFALLGRADEALGPGDGDFARPAGHRLDPVQHGGGVGDGRACRQLVGRLAARGFHHQFAAVIVLRLGEEDGHRHVGAHVVGAHQWIVHVRAELHAGHVAGKQRRRKPARQHCGRKHRI